MISGFMVKKGRMSSSFTPEGKFITVTICQALPLVVTQIKNSQKDGYQAVQLAYGNKKRQAQPQSRFLQKIKVDRIPSGFVEFTATTEDLPATGTQISIDQVFQPGDRLAATGRSRGRGFAGVIKRHGFHRQPVTRGQSDRTRAPGAIGAQTPGKVIKGKKMPGHYGNANVTIKGLKILSVDADKNTLAIIGPLPGAPNGWLKIKKI